MNKIGYLMDGVFGTINLLSDSLGSYPRSQHHWPTLYTPSSVPPPYVGYHIQTSCAVFSGGEKKRRRVSTDDLKRATTNNGRDVMRVGLVRSHRDQDGFCLTVTGCRPVLAPNITKKTSLIISTAAAARRRRRLSGRLCCFRRTADDRWKS